MVWSAEAAGHQGFPVHFNLTLARHHICFLKGLGFACAWQGSAEPKPQAGTAGNGASSLGCLRRVRDSVDWRFEVELGACWCQAKPCQAVFGGFGPPRKLEELQITMRSKPPQAYVLGFVGSPAFSSSADGPLL